MSSAFISFSFSLALSATIFLVHLEHNCPPKGLVGLRLDLVIREISIGLPRGVPASAVSHRAHLCLLVLPFL